MLELENLEVVELTTQEVQEAEGGWPRLTGFLDGIDGNLKWHWWQNIQSQLTKRKIAIKNYLSFFII